MNNLFVLLVRQTLPHTDARRAARWPDGRDHADDQHNH